MGGTKRASPTSGYIRDFITDELVPATPEEVNAVQVMLRRLVEDYGYPAKHIQSHPQHRVRRSPSDASGTYPVDIAVFKSDAKEEHDLRIIVECKGPDRTEGHEQLRLYMEMSSASIGVWFNGRDHLYLRKVVSGTGERSFELLPNIPRHGQKVDEIGLHLRKDLYPSRNLKSVFGDIRNHLSGSVVGITRDVALAEQILNVIFCKLHDELHTGPDQIVGFRMSRGESNDDVARRIQGIFEQVTAHYPDVFEPDEDLSLDSASLAYVVGELQNFSLMDSDRDAVADAFEVFVGPALRGTEGQFFTPRNVVKMVIGMLDPRPGERIIDPACGSGGFLIEAMQSVWTALEEEGQQKGWSDTILERQRMRVAAQCFRGIEKDTFLTKVSKAYMAIMGDGRSGIFCANSLHPPAKWSEHHREAVPLSRFDVVVTNPPFGSKIKVVDRATLKQYDLGHKWKRNPRQGTYELTQNLYSSRPPQILFLERCVQLLRPGGRLGIVLPESMVGNPSYRPVMQWLSKKVTIDAVIALPEPLFKTSGKGGTHTKVCVIMATKSGSDNGSTPSRDLFLADVRWCGHDSRGNPTVRIEDGQERVLDEVPAVADLFAQHVRGERLPVGRLVHQMDRSLVRRDVYVPKYYDPRIGARAEELGQTHYLVTVGTLVDSGHLQITMGVEPGKMAYGTGDVPFIRTSDISNWELKVSPKHCVSDAVYEQYRSKCELRSGDILMVRDGTYLVGSSAMITDEDDRLLFQSHIYRLRVLEPTDAADSAGINPYLLFATLNSEFVAQQIRAYQFTQDIIDTLGQRIKEIRLAIPKDPSKQEHIAVEIKKIIQGRAALRSLSKAISRTVAAGYEESDTAPSSIR